MSSTIYYLFLQTVLQGDGIKIKDKKGKQKEMAYRLLAVAHLIPLLQEVGFCYTIISFVNR